VLAVATPDPGREALAALSELAMATAFASAEPAPRRASSLQLRVGFLLVRRRWTGELEAVARASRCPSGRGWLLECELRARREGLLSVAFAYAEGAPCKG
jgi:hypothetical protein